MGLPCEQKDSLKDILDRINDLEMSRVRTDVLIETFAESNKDLSKTMKQVERTMIGIQNTLTNSEVKISELSDKVDIINQNEEKNKIDMRDVLKSSLIKLLVGALSAYGVYEAVVKIVGE